MHCKIYALMYRQQSLYINVNAHLALAKKYACTDFKKIVAKIPVVCLQGALLQQQGCNKVHEG